MGSGFLDTYPDDANVFRLNEACLHSDATTQKAHFPQNGSSEDAHHREQKLWRFRHRHRQAVLLVCTCFLFTTLPAAFDSAPEKALQIATTR